MGKKYKTIRLLLGDQLNIKHSWFEEKNDVVLYVLMEIRSESEYVTHHIQKIVGIFNAMRTFSKHLIDTGHSVHYFKINDQYNAHSFLENIKMLHEKYDFEILEYQEPDEYRLDSLFRTEFSKLDIESKRCSSEHFITERDDVQKLFEGKKQFLMETFYRKMRVEHSVLMDEDKPIGGKWNYDHDNRKKLPKGHEPPKPILFNYDVTLIINDINESELDYMGHIDATRFIWPKDRDDGISVLHYFFKEHLKNFGRYQDALSNDYWNIYHSRISFAMNLKMIHPLEVVRMTEEYWEEHREEIDLSQVEGFIRQILGWREYMRGIYWVYMPEFSTLNFFEANRKLPQWYWTGETKMNCLAKAIGQSLKYAYAHHIQRLMVTGNFALLCGVDPDEVDKWYLGIYIDAFEWVEITNTRGMSQFADGGIVGTKPYISSASYINKMGDYCNNCYYNYKDKFGDTACPFNTLYWNFIDQHKDKLLSNPRMSMMYRMWDKMPSEHKVQILQKAQDILENLNEL